MSDAINVPDIAFRPVDFRIAENALRKDGLRKSEELEGQLREINRALARLEQDLEPTGRHYPTIFIFGLPRSGTTLCQQLIAYSLDVGYINNLVARFWEAPVHGIAVSRHVLGDARAGAYRSLYGKTAEPWGVHEFSYFWHAALNIFNTADVMTFGHGERVDWREAGRRVALISDAFRRPTVFKTLFAGEFAQEFSTWMPKPIFVHVRRSLEDVALSLLRARIDYYGDPNVWWSMCPPNYDEIKTRDFAHQIAGQVVGLDGAFRRAARALDAAQLIEVEYEELVARPDALLDGLVRRLHDVYGADIDIIDRPPRLAASRRTNLSDDDRAVLAALEYTREASGG